MDRVYTFGPTFRAENSNTRRHLAEFWMIEPEMAFADLSDNADLAEDYVTHLVRHVLEHCEDDLAFFNKWVDDGLLDRLEGVAAGKFERITYAEAVRLLVDADVDFEFPGCSRRAHIYRNLGGQPGGFVSLQEQTTGSGCEFLAGNPPSCIVASIHLSLRSSRP